MRFLANGPSIPDDLLVARDAGDVIFFCGAGVSRHRANLPDFLTLGGAVIDLLGASEKSLARKLFERIKEIGTINGVGGLIATDRIFSLLEREFEQRDVQNAIARAIRPTVHAELSAHQALIDLSRGRDGTVRLVTTNFDLLFEAAAPDLPSFGPPELPDPRGATFGGLVHLHGRVNGGYSGPGDEEFVISSADFGRAYLADGWATRFMRSLLARFQIVFVGYGADDPPIQYLLEALNLHAGNRSRLFAFQAGNNPDEAALWEHRGVRAIPFDDSQGFAPLWDSLAAWADRARDVDAWYANLLDAAMAGPAALDPHRRGQVAHLLSTREGARRVSLAKEPLPASWLLALDARQRFGAAVADPYRETGKLDPFDLLGLDGEAAPLPAAEGDEWRERSVPDRAWDAFTPTRLDQEDVTDASVGRLSGEQAEATGALSARLQHIGVWLQRIAHQPIALWWAAGRGPLHPSVVGGIKAWLRQDPDRWPDDVRRGWRFLIASWADRREDPNHGLFDQSDRVAREGWSEWRVRDYAALFRPQLKVERMFALPHPLTWTPAERPVPLLSYDVLYPHPYELLDLPDEQLLYAIARFRENLDLARSLEAEISGRDYVYLQTTRPDDGAPPIRFDSFGLTGPIAFFIDLMGRLAADAPERAFREVVSWPPYDDYIFGRLRIWAAGSTFTTPEYAAEILLDFPDRTFWGSEHQRDLLYAIRDRWADFSGEDRMRIEQRLLTTTFPWSEEPVGGAGRAEAHYRLDRLHWLSHHGVTFSFDIDKTMAGLRAVAGEWSDRSGAEAADSNAPEVRRVETDMDATVLDGVPVAEILETARQAGQFEFFDVVEHRPFRGLSEQQPRRALAALSDAARKGQVPVSFWSSFLHAERRKSDKPRLARAIAARLVRLPPDFFGAIAHPVVDWLQALGDRVFSDLAPLLDQLWNPLAAALAAIDDPGGHRADSSWANDALNAPAGKLASVLLKDPASKGRGLGQGFPEVWTSRLKQLLALPGNRRRHVLVMLGFQITWLFAIAPEWTASHLLPVADDRGDDGDALWDGILWAARAPSRALFLHLKPAMLARAAMPASRRAETNVIAAFLLIGWGGEADAQPPEQLITSTELRDTLVATDDDVRGEVLRHLEHWSLDPERMWRARLVPFLIHVWPRHRALRTPDMSTRLVDLALATGDLFPAVVAAILPRLVAVRGGMLRGFMTQPGGEQDPAAAFPVAMLDLVWAILGEDPTLWPYKIEETLEILSRAPETRGDPRLSELRRRRAG